MRAAEVYAVSPPSVHANAFLPSRENPSEAFALIFDIPDTAGSADVDYNGFGAGGAVSIDGTPMSLLDFNSIGSRSGNIHLNPSSCFPRWSATAHSASAIAEGIWIPQSPPSGYDGAWTAPLTHEYMIMDASGRRRAPPTAMGAYAL
jgi:hypothetical protein